MVVWCRVLFHLRIQLVIMEDSLAALKYQDASLMLFAVLIFYRSTRRQISKGLDATQHTHAVFDWSDVLFEFSTYWITCAAV